MRPGRGTHARRPAGPARHRLRPDADRGRPRRPGRRRSRPAVLHPARDDQDAAWTQHATGRITEGAHVLPFDTTTWPPRDAQVVDIDGLYDRYRANGLAYGPVFRGLRAVWRRDTEIYAEVALPDGVTDADAFGLHPALFDAVLHGTLFASADGDDRSLLPFAWNGASCTPPALPACACGSPPAAPTRWRSPLSTPRAARSSPSNPSHCAPPAPTPAPRTAVTSTPSSAWTGRPAPSTPPPPPPPGPSSAPTRSA
ncbi:polyketide synthase dehydratase domain-containing protein [Streptomyces albulus]|nr:polyketide synthase dehydratase domain-containing protein [Streptomyces noursei]